jgi:hypothetical protein
MAGLPSHDLWLLPLVSLATVLVMLCTAELAARIMMPEQLANSCKMSDPVLGFRYRPNCTAEMKAAEGPSYTNTYNECGYRSAASCRTPPAGTRRIALIGSSLGEGHLVPYQDTVGARLSDALTALCSFPVEQQNLAARGYTGRRIVSRMQEALQLQPSAVLMLIFPYDIEIQLDDATLPITGDRQSAPAPSARNAPSAQSLTSTILGFVKQNSRAVTLAESVLFRDPSTYLLLFLHYGDKADFLRLPFTPPWIERLRRFDLMVGELASRAHKADVPMTIAFVSQQGELALLRQTKGQAAADATLDAQALPRAVAAIAVRHDVDFVDTSEALASYPSPQHLYHPVDGHPSATGERVVADAILHRYLTPGEPFAAARRFRTT